MSCHQRNPWLRSSPPRAMLSSPSSWGQDIPDQKLSVPTALRAPQSPPSSSEPCTNTGEQPPMLPAAPSQDKRQRGQEGAIHTRQLFLTPFSATAITKLSKPQGLVFTKRWTSPVCSRAVGTTLLSSFKMHPEASQSSGMGLELSPVGVSLSSSLALFTLPCPVGVSLSSSLALFTLPRPVGVSPAPTGVQTAMVQHTRGGAVIGSH